MTNAKPDCADFIIEAIRTIRFKPSNLKENTSAGVPLYRLWTVASDVYSKQEFRRGLNRLLKRGTLAATWRISHIEDYHSKKWGGPLKRQNVTLISSDMALDEGGWCRDNDGKFFIFDHDNPVEHDYIRELMFYVVADGLPEKIAKVVNPTFKGKGATAAQIIAAMQKS